MPSAAHSPEELMEKHPIEALQAMSQNLTREIDSKRQELRTMVGERYRDLMEAADTITRMSEASAGLVESIDSSRRKGAEIATSVNFAGTAPAVVVSQISVAEDDPNRPYLSVAGEIHLLMAAPEMIWSAVDSGALLRAAALYLFARHVHTGLALEERAEGVTAAQIAQWFPIVSRQWASIAHFHEAILDGCRRTLTEDGAGGDRFIDAMAASVLLKGTDAEEAFRELLDLRKEALEAQLRADSQRSTAKSLIGRSIGIIRASLESVREAFGEGKLLEALDTERKQPTLALFQTKQSPVLKYLSPIVRDFSPSLLKPFVDISPESVSTEVTAWLDGVHEVVTSLTAAVLAHVASVEAVATIRKNIHDILGEDTRGKSVSASGKKLDLWDEFYRGIFRDRAEVLIAAHVRNGVGEVMSTLDAVRDDLKNEADLAEYLWSNTASSIAQPDPRSPSSSSTKASDAVEMKAKGYSPLVQRICSQFDAALGRMLDDLTFYVNQATNKGQGVSLSPFELTADNAKAEPFDLAADNEHILAFAQQAVAESFGKMVTSIASKFIDVDAEASVPGAHLFLGRFYQAMPDLCPNLGRAFSAPSRLGPALLDDTAFSRSLSRPATTRTDPLWTDAMGKLDTESTRSFSKWIQVLTGVFKAQLESSLTNSSVDLLDILPACEHVPISEKGDDGVTVESSLRVPQHLSLAFSTAADAYCSAAYAVAPHSLPTRVQTDLSQSPAAAVASVYSMVSARSDLHVSQTVALQLLFDLNFVSQCMVAGGSTAIAQECKSAMASLESRVDPFDLSVYSPHLSTSVKRCVIREQGLFAVLIPNDRNALIASIKSSLPPPPLPSSATQQGQQQQEHNAMWTVGQRPDKIPLVPVPRSTAGSSSRRSHAASGIRKAGPQAAAGGNRLTAASIAARTDLDGGRKRSVSPVTGRRKDTSARLAAGAGSFFEAVSSSWFGGQGK